MQAELLWLANKKPEAKALYQEISSYAGVTSVEQEAVLDFDPQVANEAKDRLLLMDLGVL
jgi:hypothetical protein